MDGEQATLEQDGPLRTSHKSGHMTTRYTREDLGIAQSKVEAAQAGVETLQSLVDQMVVVAPADSQVRL